MKSLLVRSKTLTVVRLLPFSKTKKLLFVSTQGNEVLINAAGTNSVTGGAGSAGANWNPVLIALIRLCLTCCIRSLWCLADDWPYWFDLCNEVNLTKTKLEQMLLRTNRGTEALFNEALTGFSGDSATGNDPDGDGVVCLGSSGLWCY